MFSSIIRPVYSRKPTNQRNARLSVESLEMRDVPSFSDGFEAAQLDPFWNRVQLDSGTITPSPDRPHNGGQSAKMQTVNTGSTKNLLLIHDFATPTYGKASIWVYDTGADVPSSN